MKDERVADEIQRQYLKDMKADDLEKILKL
jgi:hypothetical protein